MNQTELEALVTTFIETLSKYKLKIQRRDYETIYSIKEKEIDELEDTE